MRVLPRRLTERDPTGRPLAVLPVAALAGALALAGCSAAEPEPEPAPATTSAAPSTTPTPAVDTGDMPQALADLAVAWYSGGDAATGGPAAEAAAQREASADDVAVEATLGAWNEQKLAVLTSGDDVTLAVAGPGGWSIVGGWWPSLGIEEPVLGDQRHVLLIGSDAREKEGQKIDRARGDALQLLGANGAGGAGIVGIPRDLWVPIPGGGTAKINSALLQGGPEAQVQAVADATGIQPQGYILTGFEGFKSIVADLGGLTLDAPVPVKTVPEGTATLDPDDALMFVRERKTLPGGDFDRSFHQGVALLGFAAHVLGTGPGALAESLTLVDPHVQTNLTAEQALTFAAWTYRLDVQEVGHDVPEAPFGRSADGQSILVYDDGVQAVFDDFADGALQ
ncbi:hypothetical protein GCM10022377_01900 [Zhihengliuella alba]|uniref:Cell envelope-related transcriptional attenuator domain-containing protein n=1 Tax=Zhihengliuella alba TaxID=547018 RepID=A0ABP7CLV3_9MICC